MIITLNNIFVFLKILRGQTLNDIIKLSQNVCEAFSQTLHVPLVL